MFAAQLFAGNDLRKMSIETNAILTNKEVIAIYQDQAGIEGYKYKARDSLEIWVKGLSNNDWAFCFINRSPNTLRVNFDLKDD